MNVKLERIYDEECADDCDGCRETEARHRLFFVEGVIEVKLCMVCLTQMKIKVDTYVTRQR